MIDRPAHGFTCLRLEHLETFEQTVESNRPDQASGLSDQDRSRLAAISQPLRRRQFLAGRALAQQMLGCLPDATHQSGVLAIAPSGKPIVIHRGDVHLSISHSGPWVACVLASRPVGVDIERIEIRRTSSELIEEVCNDDEQRLFDSLTPSGRAALFAELWTIKEAWLKRQGAPLDVSLMRSVQWTMAPVATANCISWAADQMIVTVLGPPASQLLSALPPLLTGATSTTRQVSDS